MSYKRDNARNFAQYQLNEGFGSAVTNTESVARMAQQNMSALPAGLQGYEGVPSSYAGMDETFGEMSTREVAEMANSSVLEGFAGMGTKEIAALANKGSHGLPAGLQGLQGLRGIEDDAFAGIEDDAFAGYTSLGQSASDDVIETAGDWADDDESSFDGYGFGEGELESWHTHFYRASLAKTDTGLISALAKAVKSVPDDTPASVKRRYYDLAVQMLKRRKNTNLRYLDTDRAELEANLGWLVNPNLPKTGGFNAIMKKAAGTVGAKLAKGEKDDLRMKRNEALGQKLKATLRRAGGLAGLGDLGMGGKNKAVCMVALGLAGAGVLWWVMKKKEVAARKSRKRKRK